MENVQHWNFPEPTSSSFIHDNYALYFDLGEVDGDGTGTGSGV